MSNPYNVETNNISDGDRIAIEGSDGPYWGTVLTAYVDYSKPFENVFYVNMDDWGVANARSYHDPVTGKSCYMADHFEICKHAEPIGPSVQVVLDSLQNQINELTKRVEGA